MASDSAWASRRWSKSRPNSARRWRGLRSSNRRSMACSVVSREEGRRARATSACSNRAMERVVREAFDVLGESARVEGLDAGENLRVQLTPLLAGQVRVRHLVSEGVLERVLRLGRGAGFMDELRALKMSEALPDDVVVVAGKRPEDLEGEILADHRRGLQKTSVGGRKPIDAGQEHLLHRVRRGGRRLPRSRRRPAPP